ncbi:MAG: response regulator [Cyclobacteriaceae bacterium]|nr:response regulator [Cyclobacteriaceae bacterium]
MEKKNFILIIDDEKLIPLVIDSFLKENGCITKKAASGKEGIALLKKNNFDLVLLDLNMPEMDGFEVLKIIKKDFPDIPVIVISGMDNQNNVVKSFRMGASDYLTKPIINFKIILHTIESAIEKTALIKENKEYEKNLEKIILEKTEALEESNIQYKQAKEKAEKSDMLKTTILSNISHELRTPLTLILAPLEQIVTSNFGNARIKNQLMLMLRNGERMLQLISQLLDLRKLETGHSQVKVAKGNIAHFIREVSLSFRELAQNRGIKFKVECSQSNIIAWFDREKFEIILFNLLSNALKYTPHHGEIDIFVDIIQNQHKEVFKMTSNHFENANSITIKIKNTGRGIPGDQIDHIFERFYSGTSKYENKKHSSGVGLEIVKKLVDLHKGQISVESKYDENGTDGFACFTLILKRGKKHFSEDEFLKDYRSSDDISGYKKPIEQIRSEDQIEISSKQVSAELEVKENTVLIVEDNLEIRKLVVDLFKDNYNILQAIDGDEGLKIAIKEIPDLIISDVMMPGTDGIELCRKVKTNINTSHIPVILLTARTAVTFKYEGLETGADDYIIKPFAVADLRLRAANLIKQRKLLKERFSRHSLLSPEEISLTSFDEKMLQRAIDCIMEHIDDKDLTIEKISKDVGMSRVHFYRKIKALTNLSASEFLRKLRMEYAAKLIKTNKLNISEVRYRIGISDADYFRKCFKAQYGVTPKEYQESIQISPE